MRAATQSWSMLPLALLAGCALPAGGAGYPDLSARPAEADTFEEPERAEVRLPDPPPADAATARAIAIAENQLTEADARFAAQRGATERAVAAARGAAVGSEAWVVAHQAISRLDAARGPARAALSAAEAALPPLDAFETTPGAQERVASHRRIADRVAAQSAVIAGFVARLRQP